MKGSDFLDDFNCKIMSELNKLMIIIIIIITLIIIIIVIIIIVIIIIRLGLSQLHEHKFKHSFQDKIH